MRRIYLLGLFILTGLTTIAQAQKTIDWKSDLEYLKRELPLKHKNLFFLMSKKEYEAQLDNISSQLSSLNDFEIAIKLQALIAKIGDTHTSIGYGKLIDSKKILPIALYWFSDGLYILQASKEYEKLLGTKISKLNGFKIDVIIDSLSRLFTVDNQAIVKNKIPNMLPLLQVLEYFKFSTSDTISIEVASANGVSSIYEINTNTENKGKLIRFKPDTFALCWQHQNMFFWDQYIEKDAIYYVQYNKCSGKEAEETYGNKERAQYLPSFADFENKIFSTIADKQINKLIFDMSFNGGGSSPQGTEFIKKLEANTKVNQKKKLYVVIGRKTFSSAIINSLDFKEQTKAILVGEETSGKPNHFGEVKNFQLPSSGLTVNYSTKYFKRTEDNLKTITPDVSIETSFSDFQKGIDPVYEWIKRQ